MRKIFNLFITSSILVLLIKPYQIEASPLNIDNKVLHDTLLTLLSPHITEQVNNYYGEYKQFGLYDAQILSINRESEGSYSFKINVQVETFEHAHNPPYGKETIIFKINPAGVKAIDFRHKGDKEAERVKKFYQDTITDIKKSFNLNLDSYAPYTYNQLLYESEKQKEYKSLSEIVEKIIADIPYDEIKPPLKNVIKPITFIKDNKGYILLKRADGTNEVYTLEKIDGNWQVMDKKIKQGKKMKKELIWYM
ncbi:DUF3888 domain-containing protein [Robertmurraya kyonggiensis]|uniref:DUF3888 domain-containing protein n=1 Tax=Robertmurraya kyonggiensis TaxID=1037680 RepID=A0A4U1D0H3_9BACI|nr:DUF3888 domain-containing protein [Robertmurraya kyonggiensis]TKC15661.1 DUF3888 domain-containing protein [Robertmurraya kyonggiensis]